MLKAGLTGFLCAVSLVFIGAGQAHAQHAIAPPAGQRWSLASENVVIMPRLSDAEWEALNPEAADVSASVDVQCLAQADGALAACHIKSVQQRRAAQALPPETPDQGFAAASLAVAARTHVAPKTDTGASSAGGRVTITLNWPFRAERMPEGYIAIKPTQFGQITFALPRDAPLSEREVGNVPHLNLKTDFTARPDSETIQKATGRAALRRGEWVRVVLLCKVDAEGVMSACAITTETLAGRGFGPAALSLVPHFRVNPAASQRALESTMGFVRLGFSWANP